MRHITILFPGPAVPPVVQPPVDTAGRTEGICWHVHATPASGVQAVTIEFDDPDAAYFPGNDPPTRRYQVVDVHTVISGTTPPNRQLPRSDKYTVTGHRIGEETVELDPTIIVTDP